MMSRCAGSGHPPLSVESPYSMNPQCPKCGRHHSIKSGSVQGKQRWKCKVCAFQFTRTTRRGKPLWQKSLVVFLYSHGLPLQTIAGLLSVQPSTVLKWVRAYESDYRAGQENGAHIKIMELSDMGKQLAKEQNGAGRLWIAIDNIPLPKSVAISIHHPAE